MKIVIIILLLSVCAFGADSVVTIAENGGDYTSQKAAFDAQQQDVTLFDPGDLLVFEYTGSWASVDSNGIADLTGYTTDTDNYIKLLGVGDARCNGVWSNTAYRSVSQNKNWYAALGVSEDYTVIDGLQFEFHRTGATGGSDAFAVGLDPSNKCTIRNCIIRRTPGDTLDEDSWGIFLYESDDTVYIHNNLIYGFNDHPSSYGIYIVTDSASAYIYNNTITECKRGIYLPSNLGIVAKNNIFSACSSAFEAGLLAASSDYNATDSTQFNVAWGSGNTNDSVNAVYDFVDADNGDWHWGSAFVGADLSGDEFLSFSTDIDGDTRTDPWDRSMDEYIAGEPAAERTFRRRESRRR